MELASFLRQEGTFTKRPVTILPDLDRALEYCEDRLLEPAELEVRTEQSLAAYLDEELPDGVDVSGLTAYFDKRTVTAEETVIKQGSEPGDMYFIESGEAEIRLETENKETVRLRTIRPGTFFGEIGLYLGTERSASVTVTAPGTFYRLSRNDMTELEQHHPEAAIAFHRLIVQILSERVLNTNKLVENFL